MPIYNQGIGSFRGTQLVQKSGTIGGGKHVFVPLQGLKSDLRYPAFGAVIANPFRGAAKLFAGDLAEYRTDDSGLNPKYYILKTFEVVSGSSTTINVMRGGYYHIPFVGDTIMVAPEVIGGNGTAVRITAVTATTVTVSTTTYDVWQLTVGYTLGALTQGDVLVEAESFASTDTHATKAMLVKTVNSVADCDYDMLENPSLTFGSDGDSNYQDARYFVSLALGGTMYTSKMSPLPTCVKNLNRSRVNGWYKVDYYQ